MNVMNSFMAQKYSANCCNNWVTFPNTLKTEDLFTGCSLTSATVLETNETYNKNHLITKYNVSVENKNANWFCTFQINTRKQFDES